jgi:hypothetical protein
MTKVICKVKQPFIDTQQNNRRFKKGDNWEGTKERFEQIQSVSRNFLHIIEIPRAEKELSYLELKSLAKQKGIEGYSKMKKAELEKLLK